MTSTYQDNQVIQIHNDISKVITDNNHYENLIVWTASRYRTEHVDEITMDFDEIIEVACLSSIHHKNWIINWLKKFDDNIQHELDFRKYSTRVSSKSYIRLFEPIIIDETYQRVTIELNPELLYLREEKGNYFAFKSNILFQSNPVQQKLALNILRYRYLRGNYTLSYEELFKQLQLSPKTRPGLIKQRYFDYIIQILQDEIPGIKYTESGRGPLRQVTFSWNRDGQLKQMQKEMDNKRHSPDDMTNSELRDYINGNIQV